jgi:hypothetical protein
VLGNVGASAPWPAPDQGKRSETDDTPVRMLSRVNLSPAPASVDASSFAASSFAAFARDIQRQADAELAGASTDFYDR